MLNRGVGVPLEDGDSSSEAGFQAVDNEDDDVLSHRRRHAYGPVRNIVQRRVHTRFGMYWIVLVA